MAAGDTSGNENPETREGSRSLLGRRDWIYLLGLLVPFIVYDLALKAILVVSQPENPGFLGGFGLMRSDILFNAGYVLFWVGLFAVARRGAYRWIVVVLFHVVTMCVALITTTAYQYFKTTGSTLDSGYVYLSLTSPEGTGEVIASELTPGILILLLAIVAYAILGPLLVTRLVSRWRGFTDGGARTARVSWLRVTGVVLAAYAMFSFSLIPGGSTTGASRAFSKDAFVNVVTTAAEVGAPFELDTPAGRGGASPAYASTSKKLPQAPVLEPRNVMRRCRAVASLSACATIRSCFVFSD